MSSVVAGEAPIINLAEDLEDGEIDDDDEEEEQQQQKQQQQPNKKTLATSGSVDDIQFVGIERLAEKLPSNHNNDDDVVFLGQANESSTAAVANKSKKPRPLEDDHAVSIENAIAKVLKKSGIEPPMPKIHNSNNANSNNVANSSSSINNNSDADGSSATNVAGDAGSAASSAAGNDAALLQQQHAPSRSSRRRKRKKEREREQKKDKDYQKRARRDSMDETAAGGAASDEMDMDEYEMMNVRGGSPPPGGATTATNAPGRYSSDWPEMGDGGGGGGYESPPDNYSSYDSYSDEDQPNQAMSSGGMPGMGQRQRRQRREREKETRVGGGGGGRKRRDRDRERERERDMDRRHDGGGGGGGGGGNKRNRRDSAEDKSSREPRKLELCKFYLKDCCAKRDKCSYMHKEFPCKYYYLGMDCYAGEDCLFHHGEPLTEQLRNILLKHMETAPKEILGDFKRISRDAALNQMTRRHEQLCEQYNMDNGWTTLASAGISRLQEQQHAAAKQHAANQAAAIAAVNANLQQVVAAAAAAGAATGVTGATGAAIPSLLDMVINPPANLQPEKKRKSRWAEKSAAAAKNAAATTTATSSTTATVAAAKPLPAHLDLVNLTQVLSAEHMAKLNKLGISNLEQMLQVPFGQLTEAGLTLPEIGEIQRKVEEAKLKEAGGATTTASSSSSSSVATETSTVKIASKSDQDVSAVVSSNSNSNSNNGFIMVDYTQYLKDAHVSFTGNDPLDDDREEDDEQLVIDDGNDEDDDESSTDAKTKKLKRSGDGHANEDGQGGEEKKEEETPPMPSVFDLPTFMSNMLGQQTTATVESPMEPTSVETSPQGLGAGAGGKGLDADPERTAFYRDIIRNPFKAHSGDADDSNDVHSFKYTDPHPHSNSNSQSRSLTPTPTPEPGSQSPKSVNEDQAEDQVGSTSIYTRISMYDFDPAKAALEDQRASEAKRERDRDTDMRLPFVPMKHYLPATEIDAAIFSHVPLRWHMQEVLIDPPSYAQLRLGASHKEQRELRDPRLRRILGLPELSSDEAATTLGTALGQSSSSTSTSTSTCSTSFATERRERKTSNCISSPDAQQLYDSTPSSPPPATVQLPAMNVPPPSSAEAAAPSGTDPRRTDPRRDPRRAHLSANNFASCSSNNSASSGSSSAAVSTLVDSSRQISEIRQLMQSSSWYQNLGSNNKIMVNQQLALVFTELKKFHQQESPNKIFDVNFIVSNQTLQQIFAKLHIYIDDNGLVVQLPEEPPQVGGVGVAGVVVNNLPPILPNMSQPPPNLVQLLRQPPPQVARMAVAAPMNMAMPHSQHPQHPHAAFINQPPPARNNNNNSNNSGNGNNNNSILGMPPNVANVNVMGGVMGNNPFNPFAVNNMNNMGNMGNMNNMAHNMGMNNMGMNNINMGMPPFNNSQMQNVPFKHFGGPGNNNNSGGGGGGGGNNQGRHFAGNNRNRGSGNRNRNNN
ncbi:hypothetical protein ACLKA7_006030 [Drosophila subpalustris]